ncbi:MAG: transglutaminase domain-containing protein [Desulfobacterales bacterium]|nr:MAG: transglutaminase domain-containing protein [Desulfobacterales bacterium]
MLIILIVLFNSCAGKYFRDAGKPPLPPPKFVLSDWPYEEYWTGIIFNGAKIGFSRFNLSSSTSDPNHFAIVSEAALHIRFLMFDKTVNLKSHDQVAEDLSMESFMYEYDLDGNQLKLKGRKKDNKLEVSIITKGQERQKAIPVKGKLYPTSIIGLYPAMHGLEVGRKYTYKVYDGETQTISTVKQEVLSYEESDFFQGQAYKIKTRFHGQEVTTWMDTKGMPLLEMSLGGIIISELESKSTAMKYLAQAAINKVESLIDFSLIKSSVSIQNPRQTKFLEIAISGTEKSISIPTDERQHCVRNGKEVFCRIVSQRQDNNSSARYEYHGSLKQYFQPSYIIPFNDRRIIETTKKIVTNTKDANQQIRLLVGWIQENIEQKPVDVFTALDVLDGKKAECQGHAFLYTAFARAVGIPTRVVNGIAYAPEYQGFLYHSWAESLVDRHWIAIDPTFGQIPADATHIKFVEGEDISDLLPLVELIGQVKLRIINKDSP